MKQLLTIITTLIALFSFSQVPDFIWAHSSGGVNYDYGQSVATDFNGNVIVSGYFQSASINFGTTTLNNSSPGSSDIFVVKYNPSGNVLWAISYGGNSNDEANGIAVDTNGDIVLTGRFESSFLSFGSTTLLNSGYHDIFIVKLNQNGLPIWAKKSGGSDYDEGYGIATDLNNNILVTGYYSSFSLTFGSTTVLNTGGSNSSPDIFVVKYDFNGNLQWVKSQGGTDGDYSHTIKSDNNGNVFVAGYFMSSSITFGAYTISNSSLNTSDLFILKYDSNGMVQWVQSAGGTSSDIAYSMSVDNSENVLITGHFMSPSISFGSTILNNMGISTTYDIFIAKYDNNGSIQWANSIGGPSLDMGNDITCDNSNNVYLTGFYWSPSVNTGITTLTNAGVATADILIAKYDAFGNNVWGISKGGPSHEVGNSLVINDFGEIYLTGRFHGSSLALGSSSLTNTGSNTSEIFIGKLACPYSTISNLDTIVCNSYVSPSGTIHTTSGTFTDTIPNAAGCDSIITINLIITQPTSSSIAPNICSNSYTAPDGQIYTQSGTYSAVIPNAAGCDSTITINLILTPAPNVNAGADQVICEGSSVTLSGTGATVYNWSDGIINAVAFQPPVGTHNYIVTGTSANGCTDIDTVTVFVTPLPVVSFTGENTVSCSPVTFSLTNTTPNALNCTWDISNGDDIIGCGSVIGTISQVGCHDVTLTTTDNNGCSNSFTAPNFICVEATPNATFTASPSSFSQPNEQIIFTNNSSGANTYFWDFGDSSPSSNLLDPTHVYEVGVQDSFVVELIAYSTFACTDTSYLTIYYAKSSDTDVFIPTGFSPNNDGENDSWTISGLENYPNATINVFNRWGQLLFEGGPSNPTWNGLYLGELLPTADYYYIIDLGEGSKYNGVVTLKQ